MNIYKIKCGSVEILFEQEACPSETQVLEMLEDKGVKHNWLAPPSYTFFEMSHNAIRHYWKKAYSGHITKKVDASNFQEVIRSILDNSPLSVELRQSVCEYANFCLAYGHGYSEAVMKTASFINEFSKALSDAPAA